MLRCTRLATSPGDCDNSGSLDMTSAVLTDNGAIFTATPRRGGRTTQQIMLGELVINDISSRPYHPQPCGKV
jgi:hypothetical protein